MEENHRYPLLRNSFSRAVGGAKYFLFAIFCTLSPTFLPFLLPPPSSSRPRCIFPLFSHHLSVTHIVKISSLPSFLTRLAVSSSSSCQPSTQLSRERKYQPAWIQETYGRRGIGHCRAMLILASSSPPPCRDECCLLTHTCGLNTRDKKVVKTLILKCRRAKPQKGRKEKHSGSLLLPLPLPPFRFLVHFPWETESLFRIRRRDEAASC